MGLLDQFTPGQQKAVMIGVPVVAVFALVSSLRKPSVAAATTTSPSGAAPPVAGVTGVMPSTDAIGTGQLADFESLLTGRINDLSVKVDDVTNLITTPAPAATPAPAPTPAPEQSPAPPPPPPPPPDPCAGRPRSVPGYAPAPDGMWAEPIVVQGITIGVAYHPC